MDSTVITRHGQEQGVARGYTRTNAGDCRIIRCWPLYTMRASSDSWVRTAAFTIRPSCNGSKASALITSSARLTQGLQQAIIGDARWFAPERGLELAQITYQAHGWNQARRIVLVRQSIKRKTTPGKTLSLFADDPHISGWRYGAMVTSLALPAVEAWRSYRGVRIARIASRN